MAHGTVKWFNEPKGFGFITQKEAAMCSSTTPRLRVGGFRSLNEGDEVEFTVTQDPKGPQAQAVKKLTPTMR